MKDLRTSKKIADYKEIPQIAGVYAFWWIGDLGLLKKLNRNVTLKGKRLKPSGNEKPEFLLHKIKWDWNLDKGPVCLYIGKSHNIATRVKWHLVKHRPSERWYDGKPTDLLFKPTTSCQFRSGLEHLFKNRKPSTLDDKLEHIGFSFIPETDVVKRFYLEYAAIGHYKPWFNVDSER